MSDMDDELGFFIESSEKTCRIRVSEFDEDVWLSLTFTGCNTYTTLTKAQAQELIDALTAVIKG
jgi:hypothetical protein